MQQPQQPTKEDFEKFHQSIKGLWKGRDIDAAINQRWTFAEERSAFYGWAQAQVVQRSTKHPPAVSAQDLIQLIISSNFNNQSHREAVARAVQPVKYGSVREYLPVGMEANGETYRMLRRTDALTTQSTASVNRELLPPYILGVNTDLPLHPSTLAHDKENSGESAISNETDGSPIGGFTFFQLGQLERFCGTDVSDPDQRYAWEYTGFGVVVRLTPSGRAEGVYIIFDFYPEDPEMSDMSRKIRSSDSVIWGWLPNSEIEAVQFSCAMIADRITDLSQDYNLRFSHFERHQVEIVRAVLASNNTIIRATIPKTRAASASPNKRGRETSSGGEEDQSPVKKVALASKETSISD
jgi:hypothetical protein